MQKIVSSRTSDISGDPYAVEHELTLDQTTVRIDLSPGEYNELAIRLNPYIAAGRKTTPQATPKAPRKPRAKNNEYDRARSAAIRAWAQEQGLTDGTRGRMSLSVIRQYVATHPQD